jgi:Uma2 family endonuclease
MTVELAKHTKVKLRVDDFDLLALNGGLSGLERTELLDGDIYQMGPQFSRHGMAKAQFYNAVLDWQRSQRPELMVLSEVSVAMPPHDEPIPDVMLCDVPTGNKGILVGSVHLLIEVADDSRKRDLGYKQVLYSRQGVPEYWVVDLVDRKVRQISQPGADGYAALREVEFGEPVESVTLVGLAVETAGIAK